MASHQRGCDTCKAEVDHGGVNQHAQYRTLHSTTNPTAGQQTLGISHAKGGADVLLMGDVL